MPEGRIASAEQMQQLREQILAAGPADSVVAPEVMGRIMAAASFQEPDRVPIWDFIDNWHVYQHFAPGETDPTLATAKVFNGLGIDCCRSIYMPLPPESSGREGAAVVSGQTRWWVDKPIKSLDDLERFELPEYTELDAMQWVADYVRARDVFAPETLYVPCDGVGFHFAYDHCGLQLFSYALYDRPAAVERLVDMFFQRSLMRAKAFASFDPPPCPLFMYGDDIAIKGRTIFSPDILRRLFYPRLRQLCEVLASAGVRVIFHTDGYIMDIVDDLLDCGILGLNPLEPLAGNDIGELKRRYGHRLVLVGGVDCSQLLPFGTPEDIRRAVSQIIRIAAPGGGFFIGSSSEIVPSTPLENVLAFYEACHELGRYGH